MDLAVAQLILQDREIAYVIADRDLTVMEAGGAAGILWDGLEDGQDASLGRSLLDLVPELVDSEAALADILAGELPRFQLELVNRPAPDGATRYLTLIALPYRGRGAEPTLLFLSADVSEQGEFVRLLNQSRNELRLTSQAIIEEHSRLRALIESSLDGIILMGEDRRVLIINVHALGLLCLPGQPEDWIGRPVLDLLKTVPPHASTVVGDALAEMCDFQEPDGPAGEGVCDVSSHTFRWLNLPVVADFSALGRLLVLHDVTEERLLERMRDDLVHTMVHDLRSPLATISISLEALKMRGTDGLSPKQLRMLENALNNTRSMSGLVNNILDVNRLESGHMPLECAPVSLADLVADTLRTQSLLAAEKGLCLESDVLSLLPPVWADARLIERVLQNLVDNAVKFTPPGGSIKVTVEQAAGDQQVAESQHVWISVADTGPGILPELQSRLFRKFVVGQLKGRGSGIGLAFCKLAVEAHGGRIWVESEPGQGATFTFTLPVAHS
jgi:signal transduction histidine kinase